MSNRKWPFSVDFGSTNLGGVGTQESITIWVELKWILISIWCPCILLSWVMPTSAVTSEESNGVKLTNTQILIHYINFVFDSEHFPTQTSIKHKTRKYFILLLPDTSKCILEKKCFPTLLLEWNVRTWLALEPNSFVIISHLFVVRKYLRWADTRF